MQEGRSCKGKGQGTRVAIPTLQTYVGCGFSTTDATGDEDGVGENVWVGCAQDER